MALSLASAGFRQFADDTVVYRIENGVPQATSLPFSPSVEPEAARAIGATAQRAARLEASVVPFHRIYHLLRDESLDPATPRFIRCQPAEAFTRLLSHAHPFDMSGQARRHVFVTAVMQVARSVELWECHFSPSLECLPALAASVEQHALAK
jgi:hypothetical protein